MVALPLGILAISENGSMKIKKGMWIKWSNGIGDYDFDLIEVVSHILSERLSVEAHKVYTLGVGRHWVHAADLRAGVIVDKKALPFYRLRCG